MNKVYVLILFLLVTVSASAQTVRGRVVDNKDQALPGCNVYVVEMNKGTITDKDGYYEINLGQVGIYTLNGIVLVVMVFVVMVVLVVHSS